MEVEPGIDDVEFSCRRCGRVWSDRYEVLSCRTATGETREYFGVRGLPSVSPYGLSGAQICRGCGVAVPGRRVLHRVVAAPGAVFELAFSPTATKLWFERRCDHAPGAVRL